MKPRRHSRTKATQSASLVSDEVLAPGVEEEAHLPMLAELRRRAEAALAAQQKQAKATPAGPRTEADTARLVHELQVHQVELELQNAELQESRDRMEESLEQFADLYDFAPVGYFTLSKEGAIQQVNLTGARLVGVGRAELIGRTFSRLVAVAARPAFQDFLKQVFAGQARHSGDFELSGAGGPLQTVNIEARCSANQGECRVVVVDITERKQVEDKVRVSEVRYRRLFEAAHDGVLLLDPVTRKITDANPFMTQLLGYPNAELVGKELFEIGLLKDEVASQEMFRKLKQKHEVRYEDLPLESQAGRHQEVEVVANLYQENGHAVIQCNIRDITERKRAEEQLRQSEERYRSLFNSMDQGYCILELIYDQHQQPVDGRFLEVNPSFEKHNGLHDAAGRLISQLAPDLEASWFAIYGKIVETGKPVRLEKESISMGGRWFDLYAFRVGGPDSRKVAVLFSNITSRKNSEQELSEKARLLDLSHDAIIVRDVKGRIRYWNHGAAELYGWSREEALGKMYHHLLRTEFPTPRKQITTELHRMGRWVGELVHRKRDGRRVTVLVRKTLDRDPEGRPASVLDNITDITARKQAEMVTRRVAVLAASNEKLEKEIVRRQLVEKSLQKSERLQRHLLVESQQMQTQLRHLSHQILQVQEEERKRISRELHDDITQTLVNISVQLESLVAGALRDPRRLKQRIARTQQLVERAVASIHQFAQDLRPPALDHLGLISTLHALMTEFMKRTGVRVHFTTFAGVERLNSIRRTILYRVVQSALSNVARHAQASRVDITIRKLRDRVCMTIQDNGKSFDPARLRYRKGSQRLGLLGMRERLEMVGGRFEIKAAPGQGTTIEAQIPLGRAALAGGGLMDLARNEP